MRRYTVSDGKVVLTLEEVEEGGYIVTSPLDPQLITEAETIREAFENARDAMAALAARTAALLVGEANVLTAARTLGGEDFSFFLQRVPGCFAWVGSQNPAKGFEAPHHSPHFDIDENAMPTGVELLDRLAREYLR